MKKTILTVLLALLLSWVIMGCGDPEPDAAELDTLLSDMGLTDFPFPSGGTLDNFEDASTTSQYLVKVLYTGVNESAFTTYKATLRDKAANIRAAAERPTVDPGAMAGTYTIQGVFITVNFYNQYGKDQAGFGVEENSVAIYFTKNK